MCIIVCVLSKKDNNLYIYESRKVNDTNTWVLKETLKSVRI